MKQKRASCENDFKANYSTVFMSFKNFSNLITKKVFDVLRDKRIPENIVTFTAARLPQRAKAWQKSMDASCLVLSLYTQTPGLVKDDVAAYVAFHKLPEDAQATTVPPSLYQIMKLSELRKDLSKDEHQIQFPYHNNDSTYADIPGSEGRPWNEQKRER